MENKDYIFLGCGINKIIFKDMSLGERSPLEGEFKEEHFCRFGEFDLVTMTEELVYKTVVGDRKGRSPYYIEAELIARFSSTDIRYTTEIQDQVRESVVMDYLYPYMKAYIMELSFKSKKYLPHILREIDYKDIRLYEGEGDG